MAFGDLPFGEGPFGGQPAPTPQPAKYPPHGRIPTPVTQSSVQTPHFDLPFTFGAYCEQGTQRDLANCVFAVVVCPKGFREEVPAFGIDSPVFDTIPVMNQDLKGDIAAQEPRAEVLFEERDGLAQLERLVKIYVQGGN